MVKTKWGPKKIKRKIGGHIYRYSGSHNFKRDALANAHSKRTRGFLARVVLGKDSIDGRKVYHIYIADRVR